MIRTTYHGRLQLMSLEANKLADRMSQVQQEATTGLRLQRPSDDPSQISHLHRVRAQARDQDVWMDNATFSEGLLAQADRAIGSMANKLGRARELAVQMSNETYSADSRELAAVEVDTMLAQMVNLANTEYGGRFVFAGTQYDQKAYDSSGTYQGTTDTPSVLVGSELEVSTGFDGSDLLQSDTDPFTVLTNLAAALRSGDADDVVAQLDEIDSGVDQMIKARTKVGEHLSRTGDAIELAETLQTEMVREESTVVDADYVDTYTRLYQAQNAYTSALQVISNSRTQSLINMI